jgi:DNA cross-link repair 1B protein
LCFFGIFFSADHTEGLRPSWNLGPIFCSPVTKTLIVEKFSLDPGLITALPVGEASIVALDDSSQETMTVTLIDANHCPGAVMFLFEGYFGRILCTGDFRYSPAMIPLLYNRHIDLAFVDNTYCTPTAEFPSRVRMRVMLAIFSSGSHTLIVGRGVGAVD